MAQSKDHSPTFRKRTGDLFRFEKEGDSIVGKLENIDSVTIGGKNVGRLHLRDANQDVYTVLQTTQMESCLHDGDIGKNIRITRGEEVQTGSKRRMIQYCIEVEE